MDRSPIERDGVRLDGDTMSVYVNGVKTEAFTHAQYNILRLLIGRPNRIYSRDEILEHLNGPGAAVSDRSVDVHIVAIRKKLGTARDKVANVRSVGYRFVSEEH